MNSLFLVAQYGHPSWPRSEWGPAAVIDDCASTNKPEVIYVWAKRVLSGESNRIARGDYRLGLHYRGGGAVLVLTRKLAPRGFDQKGGILWKTVRSGQSAIRAIGAVGHLASVILVEEPRALFPRLKTELSARFMLETAWGGGAVLCYNWKLGIQSRGEPIISEAAKVCASLRHDVEAADDEDDDEGELWRHA